MTPPVGSVLFVGAAIGRIRIEDAVKTIWPFYLALIAALLLTRLCASADPHPAGIAEIAGRLPAAAL